MQMDDLTLRQRMRRAVNRAVLRRMPPCKEVVKIISASLDRPLTLKEKFIVRLHLLTCRPCERYLQQSEFLQKATHQLDDKLKEDVLTGRLSDEARARIKDLLRSAV